MLTIGVTTINPWFALDDQALKNDLIYFDRLYYNIPHRETLEKFCNSLPKGSQTFGEKIREIEVLESAGLLVEYKKEEYLKDEKALNPSEIYKYTKKSYELSKGFSSKDKPFDDVFVDFLTRFRKVGQLETRMKSMVLNKNRDDTFIPIIRTRFPELEEHIPCKKSAVVSVLLKKFPILSSDVSIPDLVTFKNDPDTVSKLSRPRDWINEISAKHYSEKEVEQKIDYLLNEYSRQFKAHRLKYEFGKIETFVTTTLEVLENVVKLNFSKAAKTIFEIGKQEINLLESEQKLFGRELALIHDLREKNCL